MGVPIIRHDTKKVGHGINQPSHGFVALDVPMPLYLNGTTWTKAISSGESTMADGVMVQFIDANNFEISYGGSYNIGTHGLTPGTQQYLSDSSAGDIVDTPPALVQEILIAQSTTDVIINIGQKKTVGYNLLSGIADGTALDDPVITVFEDTGTVKLDIEQVGTGDLRIQFSTGIYTWDTTPAAEVTLTAGTDTAPQLNYVYFLESNKTLTASTSGWPATEHMPIATVLVQSAASLATYGAYKVHAWTDHIKKETENGHLLHLNKWIRSQQATWLDGVVLTPTITTNGGSEDNIDIATTAGNVLQLHPHAFPAFNTSTGSSVYVVNDNTTAYNRITDLNAADKDDAGNAIANNQYISLVVWGVVSEASGDCQLMINLPSGFHTSETDALEDVNGYSNYVVPPDFIGTGFLISRLTFLYTNAASGTWTLTENKSLLGAERQVGAVSSGGSGSGSGGGALTTLEDLTELAGVNTSALTADDQRIVANKGLYRLLDGQSLAEDGERVVNSSQGDQWILELAHPDYAYASIYTPIQAQISSLVAAADPLFSQVFN